MAGVEVVLESSSEVLVGNINDQHLELALKLGVQNLKVFLDSELVSRHANGIFKAKEKKNEDLLREGK